MSTRGCLTAVWVFFATVGLAQAQVAGQAPERQAPERQAVAGTTVSMTPPPGFVPGTGFAGFTNEAMQAGVMVAELPVDVYDGMVLLFTDLEIAKTNLGARGVTVTALEEVQAGKDKVPVIVGTQAVGGTSFRKWIALFKGTKAVMITVQAPEVQTPGSPVLDHATVRTMLASVSLGAEPSVAEMVKVLPFTVEPRAPFRIVMTLAGSTVLMTAGPLDTDPEDKQPFLFVGYQISAPVSVPFPPDQLDEMAEQVLRGTKELADAKIATRERIKFAGTAGVMLAGTYPSKGTTKRFVQYIAVGEQGRYVRLIAEVREPDFEKLQPVIAAIAQSIAFK